MNLDLLSAGHLAYKRHGSIRNVFIDPLRSCCTMTRVLPSSEHTQFGKPGYPRRTAYAPSFQQPLPESPATLPPSCDTPVYPAFHAVTFAGDFRLRKDFMAIAGRSPIPRRRRCRSGWVADRQLDLPCDLQTDRDPFPFRGFAQQESISNVEGIRPAFSRAFDDRHLS